MRELIINEPCCTHCGRPRSAHGKYVGICPVATTEPILVATQDLAQFAGGRVPSPPVTDLSDILTIPTLSLEDHTGEDQRPQDASALYDMLVPPSLILVPTRKRSRPRR